LVGGIVAAIDAADVIDYPFSHLQFRDFFPDSLYPELLAQLPSALDYRPMSGRSKTSDLLRVKMDLFPEQIRHLPASKRRIWSLVGRALCSGEVGEAFRRKLLPGLSARFGGMANSIRFYPIPVLTRDVSGYQIGVHPDTHWKGMTIQIYLPADTSIEDVGTLFHSGSKASGFQREKQIPFAPNSGYAFAVGEDTYHSVDPVGDHVTTRDSILLTYFVDHSMLQILRNRLKRLGNLILAELKSLGRSLG
jgi:hypothetical protein